jgi:hypothetical protein
LWCKVDCFALHVGSWGRRIHVPRNIEYLYRISDFKWLFAFFHGFFLMARSFLVLFDFVMWR